MPTVGTLDGGVGLYGTDAGAAGPADGYRALWAAVLVVALQDAVRGTVRKPDGKIRTCAAPVSGQGEAVSFLTDATGAWADAREVVADAAGVDPDLVRIRALAALRGEVDLSFLLVKRRGPDAARRRTSPIPSQERR